MVLRGSATKPETAYHDVRKAITTAREYVEGTHEEVMHLEEELAHTMEEIAHQQKSDEQLEIPAELSGAIRVLLERIEFLEAKEEAAKKDLVKYESELAVTAMQLMAGGVAGATARTTVAPIDRLKVLMQTAVARNEGQKSMLETARMVRDTGVAKFWKGNLTNIIRVFPYAAIQFAAYDRFKAMVQEYAEQRGRGFGFPERLMSGALAGATAATLTYPLDVMRVQQAVYEDLKGPVAAAKSIWNEGGLRGFYKGWTPTLLSLAPFIAINFATFDWLKATFVQGDVKKAPKPLVLGLGAGAGLFAQTLCYPLDTIRRRMQLRGHTYTSIGNAVVTIARKEGVYGFYKGILPNALKIVPNNSIRFFVYTQVTAHLGIPSAKASLRKRKTQD